MAETETPVIVNESTAPDQLAALLRQILVAVGGYAVGRGWLEEDTLSAIIAVAVIVGPLAYGQWRTYVRAKQLATVASSPRVPESVARVK